MHGTERQKARQTLLVLHPAFALTGVLQAVSGPLMPSLAATFHLNDSQSGVLFLLYFAGNSVGALLCRSNYARTMTVGFLALSVGCLSAALASGVFLYPAFMLMGIACGVPMSAISLFVGRNFASRCAPTLTLLNFSWSAGALSAPLLAAELLVHHSYRSVYALLALAGVVAMLACWRSLTDGPEPATTATQQRSFSNLRLVGIFALMAFLEVGIENTSLAWLPTFLLRSGGGGLALAAASSSLYWVGFLSARALSTLVLLRVPVMRVFHGTVALGILAAVLLVALPAGYGRGVAIFLLGAALAPIFPLLMAALFARVRHTADARWVLALCGFGGSVLPWMTGWISAHTGSLHLGLVTVPAALLLMGCLLLLVGREPKETDVAAAS